MNNATGGCRGLLDKAFLLRAMEQLMMSKERSLKGQKQWEK